MEQGSSMVLPALLVILGGGGYVKMTCAFFVPRYSVLSFALYLFFYGGSCSYIYFMPSFLISCRFQTFKYFYFFIVHNDFRSVDYCAGVWVCRYYRYIRPGGYMPLVLVPVAFVLCYCLLTCPLSPACCVPA